MAEVVMPRLSDSMEEGTVLQWLKKVGEEVAVGEELVEIETDKANMAYEADVAGTLEEILVEEGDTVPIGTPIARVGDGGSSGESRPAGPAPATGSSSSQAAGEEPDTGSPAGDSEEADAGAPTGEADDGPGEPAGDGAGSAAPEGKASEGSERVKASPLAKRMAREAGIELRDLAGSGPGGRVVKADVEAAKSSAGGAVAGAPHSGGRGAAASEHMGDAAATGPAATTPGPSPVPKFEGPETAKGQVAREELTKLQATIARRMAESKATAPHFYLTAEIDMSEAVAARARLKQAAGEGDVVPSFNDMVVKACALALREFPRANGSYRDGGFELYSRVNVGIAVAARDALVVPTVFDADVKGLRQIATDSRELAAKVRDGKITPPELSGATFSVSNLGMFGIDSFAAVINPPQAGILAVGAIVERPVVRDGEIVPAHLMSVNLACDHRILYGADGAEFLARIRTLLEEPLSLAL